MFLLILSAGFTGDIQRIDHSLIGIGNEMASDDQKRKVLISRLRPHFVRSPRILPVSPPVRRPTSGLLRHSVPI